MTFQSKGKLTLYLVSFAVLCALAASYFLATHAIAQQADHVALPRISSIDSSPKTHRASSISGALFGASSHSAKSLTVTNLNLTLKGTFPVEPVSQGSGMAIIMVGAKKDKVIHPGEPILKGVTLESVFERYVVLSRGGKQEILKFPKVDKNYIVEDGVDHGMNPLPPPILKQ